MKRLIMCEGPNELTIMNILLENDALIITEDDLIGLTPYHARQIRTSTQVRTALNLYPGNDVLIMRVGDKQSDRLTIPADYREKIIGIEKYCTMPELEILLIISEGLAKEYDKVKSTTSPKEFAKEHVRLTGNGMITALRSLETITAATPGNWLGRSGNINTSKELTERTNCIWRIC